MVSSAYRIHGGNQHSKGKKHCRVLSWLVLEKHKESKKTRLNRHNKYIQEEGLWSILKHWLVVDVCYCRRRRRRRRRQQHRRDRKEA